MARPVDAQASSPSPTPSARSFNAERLERLWRSLSDDVREHILAKASWERLPRAAVIRNWWPELWAQIS
jgi:hypothetical protein